MVDVGADAHTCQDSCRHLGDADTSVATTIADEAQGYINSSSWSDMLVSFSEKVFNACPDVLDEPLHVDVVTHAPHVDHVRAKMAGGRTLCVSETPGIYHMSDFAGGQLLESLPAFCDAGLFPPVGLGTVEASPVAWDFT